jgi:predicted ATPase
MPLRYSCCATRFAAGASTITSELIRIHLYAHRKSVLGLRYWETTDPIWRRLLKQFVKSAQITCSRRLLEDAFPGSRVSIINIDGRFALTMSQHGLLRPLGTAELSDGTLRYLLWIAALLTPRPPALMVLNEPETSLHPDLLGALARLIAQAAERTQVLVVTHAAPLISALMKEEGCHSIVLEKIFGETAVVGMDPAHAPSWQWPGR